MPKNASISKGFADQLPRNLLANIIYFIVNVVIGIFLVPYFVSNLGVAAYGLIPLATSITGYVAILVLALNTAVSRFLTIDLQKEDYEAANRTFNTSLFGLSAVMLMMAPVVLIVSWFIPRIFHVPPGQEGGTVLLFLGVSSALLIRLWAGNFTVQLFAYNRLDLQNLVNLINLLVQTVLIVLLFTLRGPGLALVGGACLAGAVVASAISIILAKQVCPFLQISIYSFDRTRVKDLLGLGGWVMIDQVGSLFLFQIDLIIVNFLFGAIDAGEYAIARQWGSLMQSIAGVFAGVLMPMIITYYALKKTEPLIKITTGAVKFMGLALALPAGLICGFAPELLTIWVGAEYANLAPLMALLTASLAVNMSVLPLFSINVAYNRVRIPSIITILLGIANLILAFVIPLVTGWGYYGVALAGVLILTFRSTIFVPWYAARVLNIRMITYIRSIVSGALAVLLIAGAAAIIAVFAPPRSLFALTIDGIVIMLIYGIIVLVFGLTPFEKQLLESYLPKKWK